ncbi:methionyl-tRNA synthetase [uncultured Mediterranean phage uvMED]|nr:methionyl-tRNA synthetase [uncultured Mediterranean phage uvMED]
MIKKFIIKGVSKKFKGLQKLKPQKTPSRFTKVLSDTQVKANQRKVLGDVPEFMGLSSRSIGDLASDSLALRTANKTFFKSLNKGLKQSRARTATGIKTFRQTKKISKLAVTKAKSKGAMKAYNTAIKKSNKVERSTSDFLKGRFSQSSFINKTKAAKRPLRDGTKLRREGDRIIDYQKKLMKDMGF